MDFSTTAIHLNQPVNPDEAARFASSRRYFALAESLGGVRALISLPGRMTHASVPAHVRQAIGLSDTLIRLSPGIENAGDLVSDLIDGLDGLHLADVSLTAGAVSDVS